MLQDSSQLYYPVYNIFFCRTVFIAKPETSLNLDAKFNKLYYLFEYNIDESKKQKYIMFTER